MLMRTENAKLDLPLLGAENPSIGFCNEFLIGSCYVLQTNLHSVPMNWAYKNHPEQETKTRPQNPKTAT
jgi:hypothetical protein